MTSRRLGKYRPAAPSVEVYSGGCPYCHQGPVALRNPRRRRGKPISKQARMRALQHWVCLRCSAAPAPPLPAWARVVAQLAAVYAGYRLAQSMRLTGVK